jgi:putative transposase
MRPAGGWKSVRDVEIAVAEYIDWFNRCACTARSTTSHPAEFETTHWARRDDQHYAETSVLVEAGTN